MSLWLLKARADKHPNDTADGFVVRARTAKQARGYAASHAGDEGPTYWLNPKASTCRELTIEGPSGIVLRDFCAG